MLFEPICRWFCCCISCVKNNKKLLDDGLDILDEELEIIGLLKSKFNPKTSFVIDLDEDSYSQDGSSNILEPDPGDTNNLIEDGEAKVQPNENHEVDFSE